MGNLPNGFDANDYQDSQFDLLPAGEYLVAIVDSFRKRTKRGDGQMLVLEMEVLRGQYQGRKLWDRLNIENPSQDAQKIALGTLSSICRSVGVMNPTDSLDLHEKPLVAVVGIRQDSQYGDQNVVKRYRAVKTPQPQVTPKTDTAPAPDWRAEAAKLGDDEIPF